MRILNKKDPAFLRKRGLIFSYKRSFISVSAYVGKFLTD